MKLEITVRSYERNLDEQIKIFLNENDVPLNSIEISEPITLHGLIESETAFVVIINVIGTIGLNLLSNAIWNFFANKKENIREAKIIVKRKSNERLSIIENRIIVANKEQIEEVIINSSNTKS